MAEIAEVVAHLIIHLLALGVEFKRHWRLDFDKKHGVLVELDSERRDKVAHVAGDLGDVKKSTALIAAMLNIPGAKLQEEEGGEFILGEWGCRKTNHMFRPNSHVFRNFRVNYTVNYLFYKAYRPNR